MGRSQLQRTSLSPRTPLHTKERQAARWVGRRHLREPEPCELHGCPLPASRERRGPRRLTLTLTLTLNPSLSVPLPLLTPALTLALTLSLTLTLTLTPTLTPSRAWHAGPLHPAGSPARGARP